MHVSKKEGQSVSSYVLKMKGYLDQLERLKNLMPLELRVSLILTSMSKEYNGFVQNNNMHSTRKTVAELHAMLKLHEKRFPKKNTASSLVVMAINAERSRKRTKTCMLLKERVKVNEEEEKY
ncbi:hypothetical protein Tco_0288562 [Tanacetum coccineum]